MSAGAAIRAGLVAALLLPAAGLTAAQGVAPAAGGVGVLSALESAPLSVVGRVHTPRRLDAHAHGAELVVESALQGEVARGEPIAIAWEELSTARPPRFAEGERLLVSLEPLPGLSIWAARIPEPERRARTWTPARRGEAFVRNPAPGDLKLLEHFLALPPQLRAENPGMAHLGLLAATGQPQLATSALERLRELPELDAALDPTSAHRIAASLVRPTPRVSDAALALLAARRPPALHAPLIALAVDDGSAPPRAYEGLAQLDGALSAPLTEVLLGREDSPGHRRVGARAADATLADRLPRLLRIDPDAGVRAAALTRLVELEGVAALDRVLFALGDPDPSVRAVAMQEVGGLGGEAVPSLRAVVDGGATDAALGAVGALRATGGEGRHALVEIAASHPDASVRQAAEIALGRPIGHRH